LSWVFYYRAIKDGQVSIVAGIDKASVVITILLSLLILKEPLTPKLLIGASLIVIGTIVLIWK
jgi:transporter family protein